MKSIWSDAQISHHFHQLGAKFYYPVEPTPLEKPHWVHWNSDLALRLNLPTSPNDELLTALSGTQLPDCLQPVAMKYAGHQFGVYNPELGDGRGLLLAEISAQNGERYDIHIKGAGLTPYSRQGDGRAVLRSSIREYLCSEALFHLGIPTTRALGLINSQTPVYREKTESGAICVRLAHSHLRFGHFEHFFYTGQHAELQQLAQFTVEQYFPKLLNEEKPYLAMLQQVVTDTAQLIAHWQAFGFAHGVLNTDNMSILGQTFDFGPFGFLDDYNPNFICNHSDYQGRYSFANQPSIGLWNLTALAHALSPLIERADLDSALALYEPALNHTYSTLMRSKIGINNKHANDGQLFSQLLQLMARDGVDYSRFFRQLSMLDQTSQQAVADLFINRNAAKQWLTLYQQRLQLEPQDIQTRSQAMRQVNPKYILRNHLAQIAIDKAESGDYSEVDKLFTLLQHPYDEQPKYDQYSNLPPDWAKQLEISCSS